MHERNQLADLVITEVKRFDVDRCTDALPLAPVLKGGEIGFLQVFCRRQCNLRAAPAVKGSLGVEVMPDNALELRIGAVVTIGRRQCAVSQGRCPETVRVLQTIGLHHAPDITLHQIEHACAARSELRQRKGVEFLVRKQRAAMTGRAATASEEEIHAEPCVLTERISFALQVSVERTVMGPPFGVDEIPDGVADVDDRDLRRAVDILKGVDKQTTVIRCRANALGDQPPGMIDPVVARAGDGVFLRMAGHLRFRCDREKRLGRGDAAEPLRQILLGRRIEPVAVEVVDAQTPVVEKVPDIPVANVEKGRRIARHPAVDPVAPGARRPLFSDALATLADAERQPVRTRQAVVVACPAGDIAVAGQDRIVKQQPPERRPLFIERKKIRLSQNRRQR